MCSKDFLSLTMNESLARNALTELHIRTAAETDLPAIMEFDERSDKVADWPSAIAKAYQSSTRPDVRTTISS